MLSWALDRLKPMFCHSGTEDSHLNTSRKRGFITKILVAWDGQPSRTRQLHLLPLLPPGLLHVSAGSMRMLWFTPPPRGPLWTHITASPVSFFTGHFGHSDALCFMFFSSHYWLLHSYYSHFIFPERAISWILIIFWARLLASFRTGWPCARWPSLATRPGRFTWMGLQVHQSLTYSILGF